jgi:hypothetical protein
MRNSHALHLPSTESFNSVGKETITLFLQAIQKCKY